MTVVIINDLAELKASLGITDYQLKKLVPLLLKTVTFRREKCLKRTLNDVKKDSTVLLSKLHHFLFNF